jgi:hypothetical protein
MLLLDFLLIANGMAQIMFRPKKISDVPVDVEIPVAPTPVRANGKMRLLYELHLTNFRARSIELIRIEVLKDEVNAVLLANYRDTELVSRLARPGAPSDLSGQANDWRRHASCSFSGYQHLIKTATCLLRCVTGSFFKSDDTNGEERVY